MKKRKNVIFVFVCNKRIKLHIQREVGSCKPYVVYKNTPMAYKCEKDELNLIRPQRGNPLNHRSGLKPQVGALTAGRGKAPSGPSLKKLNTCQAKDE